MYVTPNEVEEFAGISYKDLKVAGATMDEPQWIDFVTTYQIPIQDMIHRYCRVPTFDPTASNALVVEMKSGRDSSNDDLPYVRGSTTVYNISTNTNDYLPIDLEYYLKHLYFTGTINSVTYAPVVIEEDTASVTAIPTWTTRTLRSNVTGGDYQAITVDELTLIRFHNNIPRKGYYNLRFTYYTGYDPASDQFKAIKLQVLRCFKNFLMLKKKIQEPLTIRAHGVRDFQTMFEPFDESQILSDLERAALEPYRRFPVTGDMFE